MLTLEFVIMVIRPMLIMKKIPKKQQIKILNKKLLRHETIISFKKMNQTQVNSLTR